MERHYVSFGPFRLDRAAGVLTRDGEPLPVGQRAIRLLDALLDRRGEVVTKAELMDTAWPDATVEEANLSVQVAALRKALGPAPDGGEWIATIPRVGYRFVPAPVEPTEVGDGVTSRQVAHAIAERDAVSPPSRQPLAAPGRLGAWAAAALALLSFVGFLGFGFPRSADVAQTVAATPDAAPRTAASRYASLAVLPFDDMTGNPELSYFADGVSGDIISMLARIPNLEVVARSSSFQYRGRSLDIRRIGEELGATHVLEGSVRRDADRMRIVAQLIDARTGKHVWAERYDRSGTDPWALQDEVTAKIVAALVGQRGLIALEKHREAWGKDSTTLGEYDYFALASGLDVRHTPETTEQAIAVLKEGLAKFPEASSLKALLAAFYVARHGRGWNDSPEPRADFREAGRLAREAIADSGLAPLAQIVAHAALAYVGLGDRQFDQALVHAEAALALSPYDGTMVYYLSEVPIITGRPALALEWIERAAALYPPDDPRQAHLRSVKAYALWAEGRPEHALELLADMRGMLPGFLVLRALLLVNLGRIEEARADIAEFRKIDPNYTLDKHRRKYFYLPERHESMTESLAIAGVPED
jgi:adenylate cyclase